LRWSIDASQSYIPLATEYVANLRTVSEKLLLLALQRMTLWCLTDRIGSPALFLVVSRFVE
jgi:hypothetical protein